jgi:acetylornithine aminotransferase/putrescine aminotransferase
MTRIGFDAGLLAIFANNDPSVVQILPPLIIQEEEVMEVLGILDGMLAGLESFVS